MRSSIEGVATLAVVCVLSGTMPALAHQPGRDARLPNVVADERKFKQVLLNLLSNE